MSLLDLMPALQQHRITSQAQFLSDCEVVMARNVLASQFLTTDFTHLLFIDDDMAFLTGTVMRMIDADKGVIGCTYPKRRLDLGKALELAKTHSPASAIAQASEQVVYRETWRGVQAVDGVCTVDGLGMGLCLISRSVFEQLLPTVRKTIEPKIKFPVYGFFDHIDHLSEDRSFCARWRATGGEVFALIAEDIGHVGKFTYRARLIDALK